MVIEATQ